MCNSFVDAHVFTLRHNTTQRAPEPVVLTAISNVTLSLSSGDQVAANGTLSASARSMSANTTNVATLAGVQNAKGSVHFTCTFSDGWAHYECEQLRGLFAVWSSVPDAVPVLDMMGEVEQLMLTANGHGEVHVQVSPASEAYQDESCRVGTGSSSEINTSLVVVVARLLSKQA